MSFAAANKAKKQQFDQKHATKSAIPAKPDASMVYQAERALPAIAEEKHQLEVRDASMHQETLAIGVNLIDVRRATETPANSPRKHWRTSCCRSPGTACCSPSWCAEGQRSLRVDRGPASPGSVQTSWVVGSACGGSRAVR